jgi:hypothetical protein
MVGTSDTLIWGDLVTKEHVNITAFLNTLAEDFIPLRDVKILFLAAPGQSAPSQREVLYVKLEEILVFFAMEDLETLPEETEVRRYEPLEIIIGSFHIEGAILKSPIATLQNLLLVSKDPYMHLYKTTVRHVAKPWLGTFSSSTIQVKRERLLVVER